MRVLVAYDGSASAQATLRATAELMPSAETAVLAVYEAPVRLEHLLAARGPTPSPLEGDLADLRRLMQDEAMATAREGAARAAEVGLAAKAETAATTGSAWPVLLTEAAQQESAVLVCGTRGRGGLSRAWLGSTSSACCITPCSRSSSCQSDHPSPTARSYWPTTALSRPGPRSQPPPCSFQADRQSSCTRGNRR